MIPTPVAVLIAFATLVAACWLLLIVGFLAFSAFAFPKKSDPDTHGDGGGWPQTGDDALSDGSQQLHNPSVPKRRVE